MTTIWAATHLSVTQQGALNLMRQLERAGVVAPMRRIPGRIGRWVAHEVMAALTD
jgi:hypothetical protein